MHDPLDFWSQLQTGAWRFDFFSALRCVDALDPRAPRLGTSNHLHQDPLRLGQAVSLGFEPGMLRNLQLREGQAARLAVTFFGLTGVNGPMPLAFSEDVLSRQINHNDFMLADFLDIFHHRLLCLLYRSWAVTRPVVSADRANQDRFGDYVQAFAPAVNAITRPAMSISGAAPKVCWVCSVSICKCRCGCSNGSGAGVPRPARSNRSWAAEVPRNWARVHCWGAGYGMRNTACA